jgi:hypothetical protein
MIVSHRHRFIFLKTKKTASSSVELALSEICGPDDIITPLIPADEKLRHGRGPQNYAIPVRQRALVAPLRRMMGATPARAGLEFYNHMPATKVRAALPRDVWEGYAKVAVERNPWDREVSLYFWETRQLPEENRPLFSDFVLKRPALERVKNVQLYSIDGKIVVDRFLRYERLADDFAAFMADLGVEPPPALPHAKSSHRPAASRGDEPAYRHFYDEATREAVARYYAREIAHFGYTF